MDINKILNNLATNEIAVIPTDTLYGVVGRAKDSEVVERIYRLKWRDRDKPFIILISSVGQLKHFGVEMNLSLEEKLQEYWPGPVSVILPCPREEFEYLHRGKESLAFRLPDDENLRKLIEKTGPLVAPSANPEGMPPATTIAEAREYFGDKVDSYIDGGTIENKSSKLIRITDGRFEVIRP